MSTPKLNTKDFSIGKNELEKLRNEKELSDLLLESLPGIFYLQDIDGNYMRWNKHFETASGYSHDELLKLNPFSFFQEKDQEQMKEAVKKVFADGIAETEVEVITKDGLIVPFFLKARKINYGGKICLLGTAIDMSELQLAQKEIKKSEEKYRSLFEQASDAIMVTDYNGNFLDVNESLCKMFGYTKEELLKKQIFDLIDPEHLKTQPILFNKLAEGHHIFSKRKMLHKNGRIIEVEANVKKISEGSVLAIARDITERIKVENELAESENRLRVIFETDPECIKLLDADLNLIQMNPAGLSMIEADNAEEVYGHCVIQLLDEKDILPFRKCIEGVFEGISSTLQYGITGLKGTRRWMEMNAVPLKNKDGEIICALALSRNITKRKEAEEAIRLSEVKYKLLFNKNPFPMWMLALPGLNIIDVNDAAITEYGYSREEFLTMTPIDFRPEDEHERYLQAKDKIRDGISKMGFWVHRKKNGSLINVEIIAHNMIYEGAPMRLVLANDVTERLHAEQKLKESEFKFRMVTENEILGVAWATADARLLTANNTFCKMLGYSLEELTGLYFGEFTHPEDTKKELILIDQIIRGEIEYYQIEKRYKMKSGEYIWVELNLSVYRNSKDNSIEFSIAIVQNIHERKMAEDEIGRSHEELRRLSTYLETIREEERTSIAREIHDELGQQLTALKMDASWLNKKIPAVNEAMHEKITGMISLIDDTVKTIRRISTDLRPGILDDLGLVDALQWLSNDFEKRTGISCNFNSSLFDTTFEKKLSTGIFRVYQETLTNVARHSHASEINATLERKDDNLTLRVNDNGSGFNETEIKSKKTLGLIGMKERIKMFGGKIAIQSSPGAGTTIMLEVPMQIAAIQTEPVK